MRLYVPLTRDEFDLLRNIARDEKRRPQDQAAAIIAQAVAQRSGASLAATPEKESNSDSDRLVEVRR
jgi:hypothetical protein